MRQKIAIIGSGISGLGAAYLLSPHHDVTIYEADHRPGGHSHTVDVQLDGQRFGVDTGFYFLPSDDFFSPRLCFRSVLRLSRLTSSYRRQSSAYTYPSTHSQHA